jgi:hypothetical protein
MSVTSATSAVAVRSPTPGTVCRSCRSSMCRQCGELSFSGPHVGLERRDLVTGGGGRRVKRYRDRGRVLQSLPDLRHDALRADRTEDPELTQQTAERVQPCRPRREPGGAKTVRRRDGLVLDRLDGHRMNLLVPVGFEQSLGIGAVGAVAPYVGPHIVCGQESNDVPEGLQLAGPVVSRPAGLEYDRRQ